MVGNYDSYKGSNFKILVKGVTSSKTISDYSDNSFSIVAATTTTAPTVEVIGTPTLSLQYDSAQKESALVANYSVSVTVPIGASFKLYKYGAFDNDTYAFLVSLNDAKGANGSGTNGNYYKVSGSATDNGNYWMISAGQTATFSLTAGLPNPRILFAGSYNATLSLYKPAGGTGIAVNGKSTTNSVTIVGETSPYITKVETDPSSINASYIIYGEHFSSASNIVSIVGGKSFTVPNSFLSNLMDSSGKIIGTIIRFNAGDLGITQSGNYIVQVTANNGASNKVNVDIKVPSTEIYDTLISSPSNSNETWGITETRFINWTYPEILAGKVLNLTVTLQSTDGAHSRIIEQVSVLTSADGGYRLQATVPWSNLYSRFASKLPPSGQYNIVVSIVDPATGITHKGISGVFNVTSSLSVAPAVEPTVEFIGTPTLSLQYDSAGKESMLVGKATVKVTAGTSPVVFTSNGVSRKSVYFSLYNSARGETSGNVGGQDSPSIIPAGTSITFTTAFTQTVKTLFAGSYTITPEGLQYYADGNYLSVPKSSLINARSSNSVTIIGETSPYISKTYSDPSSTNNGYVIEGVRFSAVSNTVSINGNTHTLLSSYMTNTVGENTGAMVIPFTPSDFNITTSGVYSLQVSTTEGASNMVNVNVTVPNSPTSTPAITVLSPNGGGTLTAGTPLFISYQSYTPSAPTITMYLRETISGTETLVKTINNPTALSGQSSAWVDIPANIKSSNTYWVKVCVVGASSSFNLCDSSDSTFSIVAATTATVESSSQLAGVFNALSSQPSAQTVPVPALTSAWTYEWTHNLEIGSPYTEDIIALQTALTKNGVYFSEITGGFYAKTYVSVKAFQDKYGIEPTGFVGQQTRTKLDELY